MSKVLQHLVKRRDRLGYFTTLVLYACVCTQKDGILASIPLLLRPIMSSFDGRTASSIELCYRGISDTNRISHSSSSSYPASSECFLQTSHWNAYNENENGSSSDPDPSSSSFHLSVPSQNPHTLHSMLLTLVSFSTSSQPRSKSIRRNVALILLLWALLVA